uniref:Ribosomal protein S3 n=1 Tax=Gloiopeltis furcata TaxID=42017 RepID=A0A5A4SSZ5_9FLOR|nr:ribosomal protein S3 [Gloiopeltis furcata]BBK20771.1 ribosomal protein S3 [Gloiopeltis furcata]
MAQKTNPISFRLGSTRVWDSTFQIYGKPHLSYFLLFHKYLMSKSYLRKYFSSAALAPEVYRYEFRKNVVLVNVRNSYLTKPVRRPLHDSFSKTINEFFVGAVRFQLFPKLGELPDIAHLSHYARYLLETNTSPKKVIWSLRHLIRLNADVRKVSYHKFGVLDVKLKGFKVQMSGRFSNSKNQMAKKIVYKVGLLPLTHIKSSVDYINTEIHTKLGTCGLQIWLFYEIQNYKYVAKHKKA